MLHVNATDAKNKFGKYLQDSISEPVIIIKNHNPSAVLMSFKEYERLCRLEDQYWANKAFDAEKDGYLDNEESMGFLKNISNAKS